jgi:hypothetical protein
LSKHDGDKNFTVKAGDRMPYFLADGRSIYDHLGEPRFHLLSFSNGESSYESMHDEIDRDYTGLVDYYVVPLYPQVAEIFGTDRPFNVLLRPDNYIGFISLDDSSKDLKVYFSEFVGTSQNQNQIPTQNLLQYFVEARQ